MIINKNFSKSHKLNIKRPLYKTKNTVLYNGIVGLKSLENNRLEVSQLNSVKFFLKRFFKKQKGTVWYRLFPEFFLTKKSAGNARMGKGKGQVDRLIVYIKKGQVFLEIKLVNIKDFYYILDLLKQCKYKLPFNTKLFFSKI